MKKKYEKQDGFFMLPNDIFKMDLDPYTFIIYAYLVSCAGAKGECWPSIPTIAKTLNISPTTAQSRIKISEERRYIKRHYHGGVTESGTPRTFNNHYFVQDFDSPWRFHFFEHKKKEDRKKQVEYGELPF